MKTKMLSILVLLISGFTTFAQNTFINDKYSFSVVNPKGWQILYHEDKKVPFDHNHARQDLITYYKNANNIVGEINPTINIFVIFNSFKNIADFNKKMKRRYYEKQLINYSLKNKPQLLTIGGKYGVFISSTYTDNSRENGERYVKRLRNIFPNKNYLYYVSLIDGRNNEENFAFFNDVVNSIKIQN